MSDNIKSSSDVYHPIKQISKLFHLDLLGRMGLIDPQTRTEHNNLVSAFRVRNRHMFIVDFMALLLIPTMSTILRMDGLVWGPGLGRALALYTLVALVIQIIIFYKMDLYNHYWPSAGSYEFSRVGIVIGTSTAVLTILTFVINPFLSAQGLAVFRSLPLISGLMAFVVVVGVRFSLRWLCLQSRHLKDTDYRKRLLVVGAGEAGRMVVREIQLNPFLHLEAVAFVDDDPHKVGTRIGGLRVVGTLDMIPELVDELKLQEIVFAIPSASLGRQKEIIALCQQSRANVSNFPGIHDLLAGYKTISPVPRVDPYSLLDRNPISIDQSEIVALLKGAKVMVTGAGGSIGSGLCRQIAQCKPEKIILLGHGENSIFEIGLKLKLAFPSFTTQPAIVDVQDGKGIDWVIEKHRPDIIFHAAAHKHVPYMEEFICEAVTNNVLGTLNVVRAAQRYDVGRLVLISSDKAVNPTSIMGVTKRIAELLVQTAARDSGRAYIAVRFGNVLGSRGSVLPVFQSQIHAGGPLTITHPEMRRYFMTIPEAVLLALQAAVLGKGGEIFILDMGEQVRILDLATRLVNCSGFKVGRDIEIVFSGVRPGEKLEEELFMRNEKHGLTKHQKISVAIDNRTTANGSIRKAITELIDLAQSKQVEAVDWKLHEIIPEYQAPSSISSRKIVKNIAQAKTTPLVSNNNTQRDHAQKEIETASSIIHSRRTLADLGPKQPEFTK